MLNKLLIFIALSLVVSCQQLKIIPINYSDKKLKIKIIYNPHSVDLYNMNLFSTYLHKEDRNIMTKKEFNSLTNHLRGDIFFIQNKNNKIIPFSIYQYSSYRLCKLDTIRMPSIPIIFPKSINVNDKDLDLKKQEREIIFDNYFMRINDNDSEIRFIYVSKDKNIYKSNWFKVPQLCK